MAETEQTEEQESAGSPLIKLILCCVVSMLSGAAGFALAYVLFVVMDKEAAGQSSKESPPAFIAFGQSVVNLDEGHLNRYLRVSVTLQVDENDVEAAEKSLEKNKAILKNWLLMYLSDKSMDDIRGAAGQNRLRREIQNHFNTVLFPDGFDRVRDVLFEEFNVQ